MPEVMGIRARHRGTIGLERPRQIPLDQSMPLKQLLHRHASCIPQVNTTHQKYLIKVNLQLTSLTERVILLTYDERTIREAICQEGGGP